MISGTPGSSGTPPDPLGSKKPDLEEDSVEPIENSLLRVLVTDRSFRWAAIAVALLVGSVLVAVTPLFVVSTPEIDPPDRVSLLDKFQSRSRATVAL